MFKALESKEAAEEAANQAFMASVQSFMAQSKTKEENGLETQKEEESRVKDPFIEKIRLVAQLQKVETVLNELLFTKQHAALYAYAAC